VARPDPMPHYASHTNQHKAGRGPFDLESCNPALPLSRKRVVRWHVGDLHPMEVGYGPGQGSFLPKYCVEACASPFNAPWNEGCQAYPCLGCGNSRDKTLGQVRSRHPMALKDMNQMRLTEHQGRFYFPHPDLYSDKMYIHHPLCLHGALAIDGLPISS
jgi:hypothetical protein